MSNFEKKEQNLNRLVDKLNSLSLSYSQPKYEIEKIKSEKNELANKKKRNRETESRTNEGTQVFERKNTKTSIRD